MNRAESAFRDAFKRLQTDQPQRLPKGTVVSQNNIAREAGYDPSALRKSRFPTFIAEIQQWLAQSAIEKKPSARQTELIQGARNKELRDKIKTLQVQRDNALSLLVEADRIILELTAELETLRAVKTVQNVTPIIRN
ncbi:hypothetical protein CupriaWKF_03015 [Cupriavidus sp. WKF15]|uniref:hypothetical protein n=1 Tax=Cupriavidus sp. WKF15 TaxID=3032282 RepID=UPI0023E2A83D|nr:hypothetical protein [Cupriavidus sp. WKF15]WER46575.1 hypothetical protein CupriaWKF_03015 [Cupriavidus sp. WKF15]